MALADFLSSLFLLKSLAIHFDQGFGNRSPSTFTVALGEGSFWVFGTITCLRGVLCKWCKDWRPLWIPAWPWRRTIAVRLRFCCRCSLAWCGTYSGRAWGTRWLCFGSVPACAAARSEPLSCSCATCSSEPPPPSRWRMWRSGLGRSTPGHESVCLKRTSLMSWTWDWSNDTDSTVKHCLTKRNQHVGLKVAPVF